MSVYRLIGEYSFVLFGIVNKVLGLLKEVAFVAMFGITIEAGYYLYLQAVIFQPASGLFFGTFALTLASAMKTISKETDLLRYALKYWSRFFCIVLFIGALVLLQVGQSVFNISAKFADVDHQLTVLKFIVLAVISISVSACAYSWFVAKVQSNVAMTIAYAPGLLISLCTILLYFRGNQDIVTLAQGTMYSCLLAGVLSLFVFYKFNYKTISLRKYKFDSAKVLKHSKPQFKAGFSESIVFLALQIASLTILSTYFVELFPSIAYGHRVSIVIYSLVMIPVIQLLTSRLYPQHRINSPLMWVVVIIITALYSICILLAPTLVEVLFSANNESARDLENVTRFFRVWVFYFLSFSLCTVLGRIFMARNIYYVYAKFMIIGYLIDLVVKLLVARVVTAEIFVAIGSLVMVIMLYCLSRKLQLLKSENVEKS